MMSLEALQISSWKLFLSGKDLDSGNETFANQLELRSPPHDLFNQPHYLLRSPVRGLIAITCMSVIMDHPNPITNLLFLKPCATEPERSQADTLADNTEVLDSPAARQSRAQIDCPLHDSVREVGVDLRVPVALLVASADKSSSACVEVVGNLSLSLDFLLMIRICLPAARRMM
jgi:hypothetical protein